MNWNELKHIDELKGNSLTKDLENIIIPNPFIYSLFSNYEVLLGMMMENIL